MSVVDIAAEYGAAEKFVTKDLSASEKSLIKKQTQDFLETKAGKYIKYQLLTAYLRMAQRASSTMEVKRDYYSGRMDQAGADLALLSKVLNSLAPPEPRS